MRHVFATPSLATWRPQGESLWSGSWQDVTRASLSDRFRARGEEVSCGDGSGRARASLMLPALLPLHYPAAPFVPSLFAADCPKRVQRGCFALRRRRTARAFRDTSVIIRRGCRNRVPARGRARERVSEIGKDASTWRTVRKVARWRSRWGWKSVSRWN